MGSEKLLGGVFNISSNTWEIRHLISLRRKSYLFCFHQAMKDKMMILNLSIGEMLNLSLKK